MICKLKLLKKAHPHDPKIFVFTTDKLDLISQNTHISLSEKELIYIQDSINNKIFLFQLPNINETVFIQIVSPNSDNFSRVLEEYRIAGSKLYSRLNSRKIKNACLYSDATKTHLKAFLEGFLLSTYRFTKYKTEKAEEVFEELQICDKGIFQNDLASLEILVESVFIARDLINEPGSELTATALSQRISDLGKKTGFYTEIFNKSKIESLKMGGLLAVNRGSIDPPTFSILEWKPDVYKNDKPIVLVRKGVVFDTGGLSLKPTANSMDYMKSDMSGAACVIAVIHALAKMKIPVHVIGLIPATDNRPGQNAYYPGDVIRMYNGSTVEVLNTDAEGRMILADALSYAKKYDPQLLIDIATLTGSAAVAVGSLGMVGFFKTDDVVRQKMKESGDNTYERIVEFPLWDEYEEMIKSDIADVKNIGGREAGAITAAKFLERFTAYPWIHLDIAGTAFSTQNTNYICKGGTGSGIRLITNYIINSIK